MDMTVFSIVKKFLDSFCVPTRPLLLALSGGPDSLCLFYTLLHYQKKYPLCFHIAHVDHGWREESQTEAEALQQLAKRYNIPFHLKRLELQTGESNLEARCRIERYTFFSTLCDKYDFQGVLVGHHQNDQAETVLKRMLEGAHWSRWKGLSQESWIYGVRVLRPLLSVSKKEIIRDLDKQEQKAFDDPTNRHLHFLRARLRETIFPRLNQEFGKCVEKNMYEIGEEARELADYFQKRIAPLVAKGVERTEGFYWDFQECLPESLIEIKFLIRLICEKHSFFLSREMVTQMAQVLHDNCKSQVFSMGKRHLKVERRCLSLFTGT